MDTAAGLIAQLRSLRSPRDIEGQRRFGITPATEHLGIAMTVLRPLARPHRRNHALAQELWASTIHDARILALLIDDPRQVTRGQMEAWAGDFDSWALTDGCCIHLFNRTPFAVDAAHAWSRRRAEYMKRAGFALMAGIAVHRKELPDETLLGFLPDIAREAEDERNFVRKAVNWALRQIGKRNPQLRLAAIKQAMKIARLDSRTARWIARDALRELRRHAVKRQGPANPAGGTG